MNASLIDTIILYKPLYKYMMSVSCRNCIYFNKSIISEESQCFKFSKKEINNAQQFEYSKDCRNDETKCGRNAKFFISKFFVKW